MVTVEVEARNLDKKVCLEEALVIQELRARRAAAVAIFLSLITGVSFTSAGLPRKI